MKYSSPISYNLTLKELKEGQLYVGTLMVDNQVMINECIYKIINGSLCIHRVSNWEDVSVSDLSDSAFMVDNSFKWPDAHCFKEYNS